MRRRVLDWFDRPDPTGRTTSGEVGLRFSCTQCGNCCTGPTGFVLFTEAEGRRLAARLGMAYEVFLDRYTCDTSAGRSLNERRTRWGYDCVFLDRESRPGVAGCSVYEDRPEQCRTWPFWKSVVRDPGAWERASRTCPGINRGRLHGPEHVRLTRDRLEI